MVNISLCRGDKSTSFGSRAQQQLMPMVCCCQCCPPTYNLLPTVPCCSYLQLLAARHYLLSQHTPPCSCLHMIHPAEERWWQHTCQHASSTYIIHLLTNIVQAASASCQLALTSELSHTYRMVAYNCTHHEFHALPSCCFVQKRPARAIASRFSRRPAAAANHACIVARMRRFCNTCNAPKQQNAAVILQH